MPKDKNALKAGLFIIAAIALAAGFLVMLQGSRKWFEPDRTATAAFDLAENLGGLKPGDPLRVGGFDQGHVTDVRYVTEPRPHLEVDFSIPEKYDLRDDAVVSVEQALTGAADLNVTDFGHGEKYKTGHALDGRPSAIAALYDVAPQVSALIHSVGAKVNPAYDRYAQTLAKADAALDAANGAMTGVRGFLGDGGPDFRQTLANLKTTTTTFDARLPGLLDKADGFIDRTGRTVDEARDAINGLRGGTDDFKATLANAKAVTAEARGLLVRNRTRVDNILKSGREAAANLEGASIEIRRSPWRLLYKPSEAEMGNLNLYDTTRQFARAAAQLDDAAAAVRDAAADPAVDRKDLQAMLDDLKQTFSKYREVEQAFWRAVK